MDPSQPDPEKLQPLIFHACTAWEAQTGRKLGDEASVVEFLRALKTGDLLVDADPSTELKVREALTALTLQPGVSLPGLLTAIGVTGSIHEQFLSILKNSSQRETLIKDAFAAGSPAETAKALESIASGDNPQSLFNRYFTTRPPATGKAAYWLVVLFIIVSTVFIFIMLGPQIKNLFATAYKGVTPDPGGGNG